MSNLPRKGERVVFVELSKDGTPYQVFTRTPDGHVHQFDIEHSASEGRYLMEESGGSGPRLQDPKACWWAHVSLDRRAVEVKHPKRSGRRGLPIRGKVPYDYVVPGEGGGPIEALADWAEVVDRLLYCPACNDWFTAPDHGPGPCEHVTYCEACGMWDGQDGERCRHGKSPARPDQSPLFDTAPEEDK